MGSTQSTKANTFLSKEKGEGQKGERKTRGKQPNPVQQYQ